MINYDWYHCLRMRAHVFSVKITIIGACPVSVLGHVERVTSH